MLGFLFYSMIYYIWCMLEEKRAALIRRAGILIDWLHREDRTVYNAEHSAGDLVYLIDLIIWTLERSIKLSDWKVYYKGFVQARNTINKQVEKDQEKEDNYKVALVTIEETLKEYIQYVESDKLTMAVE